MKKKNFRFGFKVSNPRRIAYRLSREQFNRGTVELERIVEGPYGPLAPLRFGTYVPPQNVHSDKISRSARFSHGLTQESSY